MTVFSCSKIIDRHENKGFNQLYSCSEQQISDSNDPPPPVSHQTIIIWHIERKCSKGISTAVNPSIVIY